MIDLLIQWGAPAIGLIVAFLGYGALQRNAGKNKERADAAKDTVDRVEKGRDAVDDGRDNGTPADRLRDNDGQW